jgi:hypothetical protein
MKARLVIALPFLFACSSAAAPLGGAGGASTDTATTSGSAASGGGAPEASSCGPDLGALAPAAWGRLWSTGYANSFPQQISVSDAGAAALVGLASGNIDFGTGAQSYDGAFLAAYDGAGAPVATTTMDALWAPGAAFQGADLYTVSTDGMSHGIIFEKRSSALASTSQKPVGVATPAPGYDWPLVGPLVARPDGNLIMTGAARDLSLQIGSTAMTFGEPDAFVAALDPEGNVLWATQLGLVLDAPSQGSAALIHAAAVGPSGAIALAGTVTDSTMPPGQDEAHAFLAKLDASGAILWARAMPVLSAGGGASFGGLAITPDGSVIASGRMQGTVDLGGGPLAAGASWSGLVARYDPTGALTKAVITTEGCAAPMVVGWTTSGDLAVVGVKDALYRGTLDPATLVPSYTRGYAISAAFVDVAALTPSGSLVACGQVDGPSDFGQGPVTPSQKVGLHFFLAGLP